MNTSTEQPICCGKYCEETNNLTLAMGWNKYHLTKGEMITQQWFCQECIEDYTTSNCKSCGNQYKYTEMYFRSGGYFGIAVNKHDHFFCVPCIKYINAIEYTGFD